MVNWNSHNHHGHALPTTGRFNIHQLKSEWQVVSSVLPRIATPSSGFGLVYWGLPIDIIYKLYILTIMSMGLTPQLSRPSLSAAIGGSRHVLHQVIPAAFSGFLI